MKTYKQFIDNKQNIEPVDEGVLFGIAIERKLKSALLAVKATDDIGQKLDILMKSLHFSIGGLAYELQKRKKSKR